MPHLCMVIAPQQFRDEELLVPRGFFEAAGHRVLTVSTQTGPCQGMLGHTEVVTATLADVDPSTLDALVIVGGYGSVEHLWHHDTLHQLCQSMVAQGAVVAALCVSPVVLAKAGVLTGKQASVWRMPESEAAFAQANVTLSDDDVTVDDNIITGNSPDASIAFAEAVMAALLTKRPA
jgi:protease I